MIRNLLATTAVAALLATGAYAQTTPAPAPTAAPAAESAAPQVKKADGHLASNLIGETVYNGTGDNAENIGEVNDLVLNAQGQVEAVVIGVGGFLGLGEKNVAIEYGLVSWSQRDGNEFLVVETTADALKAQQDFDRLAYEPVSADTNVTETKPATAEDLAKAPVDAAAPASDTTAMQPAPAASDTMASNQSAPTGTTAGTEQQAGDAAPAQPDATATAPAASGTETTAQAPAAADAETTAAIDRSTLTPLDTTQIKSEEFVGTTVYGANDEMVGEIGDVVMNGDKVDAVIIDVGGFLGMGEKEVAVGLDNLAFMTDADGDRYLYTEWTKEQLEAQPAYDEGSYTQNRDTMRLVVPN